MKRVKQSNDSPAMGVPKTLSGSNSVGLVLSGGGSRAAYQVGALKALAPFLESTKSKISVVVGSSIGAVNGIVLGACLKHGISRGVEELEGVWRQRTYRNTFNGSPSMAFLRALKVAFLKYSSPNPDATRLSIFDPEPLRKHMDQVIDANGGLSIENRDPDLNAVAVMTTIEGKQRRPLLFLSARKKIEPELLRGASFDVQYVETLSAKHGLASAALPSVLPPVDLDVDGGKVTLVDGGISINIPVDPAVRLGADRCIVIDISGREWWLKKYGQASDSRPDWEVQPGHDTFCLRPPETFVMKNQNPLGPTLKASVAGSTRSFIQALGPTWPIFSLLKRKMGEDLAYEVMSYVALHPDYLSALIEQGYNETMSVLKNSNAIRFEHNDSFDDLMKTINTPSL
jgi:predicted acylesterase/phospholipase RssA